MKKLLIFDLDGTLLDTLDDLKDSVNYALNKHNFPERSREEIRNSVGNGFAHLVSTSLPCGAGNVETVLRDARAYYKTHFCEETAPYEGILDMLEKLKAHDYALAIVSNKPNEMVLSLQKRFFSGLIIYAVGEKEGVARKPAPDSVFAAMRHFNASNKDTVYIGDSEVDLETAKNAGIESLIVGWGFRTKQELEAAGVTKILPNAEALYRKILSL